jgi:hypothetical protein
LKLGQESGDDKTQVGCITLLPDNVDMVVMNLGDISPAEPVERSSITAAYEYQEE